MASNNHQKSLTWGYQWRSSTLFIVCAITIGLFSETFLYGFIVPILGYMLETRLRVDKSRTQALTSALLGVHGFFSVISGPVIAHYADKAPNKKIPLLVSLAGCLLGTALVASCFSLWALFLGRILQAVAGSAVWIIGFATLADAVGLENMGKILGTAMSFVTAGTLGGPIVAGALLELVGYWATWSAPLAVLAIDIVLRLVMIQHPKQSTVSNDSDAEDGETTGLLSESRSSRVKGKQPAESEDAIASSSALGFYKIMLSEGRVIAALASSVLYSSVLSSFEATLPLHVRDIFGWGSLPVGMMFFCLQIPAVFLNPMSGMLRDKIGMRYPVSVAFLLMAPVLLLLGTPGSAAFPWADPATRGKAIYISSVCAAGVLSPFINGVGSMELAAAVQERQNREPGVFGSNGGMSRVFSLSNTAYTAGTMIGPIISGPLVDRFGYYYMTFTFAVLCIALSIASFFCLKGKDVHETPQFRDAHTSCSGSGSDEEIGGLMD